MLLFCWGQQDEWERGEWVNFNSVLMRLYINDRYWILSTKYFTNKNFIDFIGNFRIHWGSFQALEHISNNHFVCTVYRKRIYISRRVEANSYGPPAKTDAWRMVIFCRSLPKVIFFRKFFVWNIFMWSFGWSPLLIRFKFVYRLIYWNSVYDVSKNAFIFYQWGGKECGWIGRNTQQWTMKSSSLDSNEFQNFSWRQPDTSKPKVVS